MPWPLQQVQDCVQGLAELPRKVSTSHFSNAYPLRQSQSLTGPGRCAGAGGAGAGGPGYAQNPDGAVPPGATGPAAVGGVRRGAAGVAAVPGGISVRAGVRTLRVQSAQMKVLNCASRMSVCEQAKEGNLSHDACSRAGRHNAAAAGRNVRRSRGGRVRLCRCDTPLDA